MSTPLLEIAGLTFGYPGSEPVLKDVSFCLVEGERVALLGPTGAGKSTLLHHLNGILEAGSGTVRIMGLDLPGPDIREVRRQVGLVFQDADDQLFMPTLLEDVAFALLNDGVPEEEAVEQADEMLHVVGLEGKGDRAAHHLSGGEQRLAALATILVTEPRLLVLDEPTGGLDARGRARILGILRERRESLLLATHDLVAAHSLCDRALVLEAGQVAWDGPLARLLADAAALERYGLSAPLPGA